MKVKVCGLNNQSNIDQLNNMDIDYLGFIFYKNSPRFLNKNLLLSNVSKNRVGVFVNEKFEEIKNKIENYNLTYVQLHGDENPILCKKLMNFCKVIKAFRISDKFDFKLTNEYTDSCNFFLFDTFTNEYGGSGKKFDWKKIISFNDKKFFLSGGIDSNSIDNINVIKKENNQLYAVDINSNFETKPGFKDLNKIKIFLKNLKNG